MSFVRAPRARTIAAFLGAIFFFLIAVGPVRTFFGTFFFIFQARDMERARQILEGRLIFFGPEITGGGNLLGPLYYYLMALPLAIWNSWQSVWGWMMVLTAAGAAAGWLWLRARLGPAAAWLWLGIFSCAYFSRVLLELFLNVSFLPGFAVVALIFICESYAAETVAGRRRALWGACFLLGLGIQLHFSVIVWLGALAALHLHSKQERGQLLPAGDLAKGLLMFALPLLPYFGWKALAAAGFETGQQNVFSGKTVEALPTMVAYVRKLAQFPLAETAGHAIRLAEVLPATLLLVVPALFWNRGDGGESAANSAWLKRTERALLFCAAFGLIPFAYFFVAPIGRRYVIPLGIPVHFLTVLLFERCRQNLRGFLLGGLALLAAMFFVAPHAFRADLSAEGLASLALALAVPAAAMLFGGGRSKLALAAAMVMAVGAVQMQRALIEAGVTSSGHVGVPRFVPNGKEWQVIWKTVRGRTCWSYEEAIRRLYFVNHHLEQDPQPGFELAAPPGLCRPALPLPDGFFISILKRSPGGIKEWLLASHVQEDLKVALRNGALEVGEASFANGILVAPYWVRGRNVLPAFFHDTGEAYQRSAEDGLVSAGGIEGEAKKLGEGAYLFSWNECPGQHPYCGTGAVVRAAPETGGKWAFRVRVLGSTISQISPWIAPEWTASWRRPYFEVRCGKQWKRFELATSIGYEQAYGHRPDYPFDYNNSFVAPFERELSASCPGGPKAIALGREETRIENVTERGFSLPARRLETEF